MRVKELEAAIKDGTPVVCYGKRATVLAVRQPRRVYSGERWDFGGHTANDGVKLRYEDGKEEIAGPRTITAAADHEAEQDAKQQKADALAAQKARAEAAATVLGGHVRTRYPRPGLEVLGYTVMLTLDEAESLVSKVGH